MAATSALAVQSALQDMFPHLSGKVLIDAAETGDIELAIDFVLQAEASSLDSVGHEAKAATEGLCGVVPHGMPPHDKALRQLRELLPEHSDDLLISLLVALDYDVDAAFATALDSMSGESKPVASVESRAKETYITYPEETESRGRAFEAFVPKPPAADLNSKKRYTTSGWEISCSVDCSKPCQSLRSLMTSKGDKDPGKIVMDNVGSDDAASFASICFQQMLQKEQELEGEFCVFYHSYNCAALLYEVQSEIARYAFGLPDQDVGPPPPFPRVRLSGFNQNSNAELLKQLKCIAGQGKKDHDPEFRKLALSVSPTLFAFGSEAPPLQCFRNGYGCTDLSFRNLLVETLRVACGSHVDVDTLADELSELAEEYGLFADAYYKKKAASQKNRLPMGGQMLQIFVARAEVDAVAYRSHAYGVPVETSTPISQWLTQEGRTGKKVKTVGADARIDGQARLLFHPEMFSNPSRGRIYHYCGDWQFFGGDEHVPGSRGAMILKLRELLRPYIQLEDKDALRRRLSGS
eukprot:TRINITY_DN8746_c0_g6_i1.p1 TRINITY_DN8746_c0_g6~~TRINITY_DN8746_c0_g6_i1.p1  ORF type:complete len:522 (+),score=73.61 TRINITY_DN8746_c0_g6_i1:72-1637(+)